MATRIETLAAALPAVLGDKLANVTVALGEVTVVVPAAHLDSAMRLIRDRPELRFEMLLDICGVDYSTYGNRAHEGPRFAAVYHLLSLANNWRLRVRAFVPDEAFPVIASVVDIWPAANWFEREAFDLYGIMFAGHPDLRRLLTDYGFVGHPFRKDFPLSGHVEVRYDPEQGRVIYQPVSIEPREVTPRILREDAYGAGEAFRKD
jgi:NADH-quinone oxidoreductase subunit C